MSCIENDLIKEKLFEKALEELESYFSDQYYLEQAATDLAEKWWNERN